MDFGPVGLWNSMGGIAKGVALILLGLSIYSLTVSVERFLVFKWAKKQSLEFARLVTQFLKQNRPQDAIAAARKYKHSHLAKVVSAGLLEFQNQAETSPLTGEDIIEAARRAIERTTLITTADACRAELVNHLTTGVDWVGAIRAMRSRGINTFIEVGPGQVLTGLVKRIVDDAIVLALDDKASPDRLAIPFAESAGVDFDTVA